MPERTLTSRQKEDRNRIITIIVVIVVILLLCITCPSVYKTMSSYFEQDKPKQEENQPQEQDYEIQDYSPIDDSDEDDEEEDDKDDEDKEEDKDDSSGGSAQGFAFWTPTPTPKPECTTGGSGTVVDPFVICYIDELAKVGTGTDGWDSGDSYMMGRNLNFDSGKSYLSGTVNTTYTTGLGWKPLGMGTAFSGNFYGNNKEIVNLYSNRPTLEGVGLFSVANSGAKIQHLTLKGVNVTGYRKVGGLIGWMIEGSLKNIKVGGSVQLDATMETVTEEEPFDVGGIAGRIGSEDSMTAAYVINSFSSADVYGFSAAGGLVGSMEDGGIEGSRATGEVSGKIISGGLLGYSDSGYIINSSASGDVSNVEASGAFAAGVEGTIVQNSFATGNATSEFVAGGFVAANHFGSVIVNSYSTGDASAELLVGGFVGINLGEIYLSYAAGNAIAIDEAAGGFVGANIGLIEDCLATGDVYGDNDSNDYIGPFVGDPDGGGLNNIAGYDGQTVINYGTGGTNSIFTGLFTALNVGDPTAYTSALNFNDSDTSWAFNPGNYPLLNKFGTSTMIPNQYWGSAP